MIKSAHTIKAIEGLRAIAVVAVIAFHLFPSAVAGGFLGVDLFFVISGYVITALLAKRIRTNGTIGLKRFYHARIKRLLPASIGLMVSVLLIAAFWARESLVRGAQDVPFILTGTYNWRLGNSGLSYFDQWTPPLFQHLWSLAVETQFYLLWPLILLLLTMRFTARQIATGIAAVGATVWLWGVIAGLPISSSGLAAHYFSTRTHLLGLMLGAALALVWTPERLDGAISPQARKTLDGMGFAGALITCLALLFVSQTSWLYSISFGLVAISTALWLAVAVHPESATGRLLGTPWLVAIGQRSYSLYLWHWPLVVLIPSGSQWSPVAVLVATVLASELSYRFIEVPFRQGLAAPVMPPVTFRLASSLAMTAAGLVAALGFTLAGPASSSVQVANAQGVESDSRNVEPVPAPVVVPSGLPSSVFLGDSVLLGVRTQVPIDFNVRVFDAVVGRQAPEILEALNGIPPELEAGAVVLNLGNNGQLRHSEVMAIFSAASRFAYPVVINARVPRAWETPNNELLSRVAKRFPNIQLIDWYSVSADSANVGPDKIHLTPTGAAAMVNAIQAALDKARASAN